MVLLMLPIVAYNSITLESPWLPGYPEFKSLVTTFVTHHCSYIWISQ